MEKSRGLLLIGVISMLVHLLGCQTSPKSPPADPGTLTQSPVGPQETSAKLNDYSLDQLAQARLFFRLQEEATSAPEGEGYLGCRFERDVARALLKQVDSVVKKRLSQEAKSYLASPNDYLREHQVDNCSPGCLCEIYAETLASVEPRYLSSPKSRATHEGRLRRLKIKSERLSGEELRQCGARASWLCSDLLRDQNGSSLK